MTGGGVPGSRARVSLQPPQAAQPVPRSTLHCAPGPPARSSDREQALVVEPVRLAPRDLPLLEPAVEPVVEDPGALG